MWKLWQQSFEFFMLKAIHEKNMHAYEAERVGRALNET